MTVCCSTLCVYLISNITKINKVKIGGCSVRQQVFWTVAADVMNLTDWTSTLNVTTCWCLIASEVHPIHSLSVVYMRADIIMFLLTGPPYVNVCPINMSCVYRNVQTSSWSRVNVCFHLRRLSPNQKVKPIILQTSEYFRWRSELKQVQFKYEQFNKRPPADGVLISWVSYTR